ncbi:VOC family protein [Nocardioides sp. SOB77]|uniref:VOC family protein n=1 Tax=Nocardioides oceani TaxID=3058369 RepID=A0ABT8FKT2_9ACTN|nr:VOC family protein [Nocardioides oceani]MDN4175297.1 VOC family protein [Nocardioides oceani]
MYLENVVFDASAPRELGRFWEAVAAGEQLTDEPAGYETRLSVPGGPELDLCFQPVPEPAAGSPRLHLDVGGGADEVALLLALGARRAGADGGGDQDGVEALLDPEGNPFRVVAAGERPLAAIRLESADPERDVAFWAWLTSWVAVPGAPAALRHPSGLGPVLELVPEAGAKGATKNRRHLDLRLEPGDDAVAAGIAARGGRELPQEWGELPWRSYADPSGNELCLLPARS